jgi:hypothetical protein
MRAAGHHVRTLSSPPSPQLTWAEASTTYITGIKQNDRFNCFYLYFYVGQLGLQERDGQGSLYCNHETGSQNLVGNNFKDISQIWVPVMDKTDIVRRFSTLIFSWICYLSYPESPISKENPIVTNHTVDKGYIPEVRNLMTLPLYIIYF